MLSFPTLHGEASPDLRAAAPAADPGKRGKEERARATFPICRSGKNHLAPSDPQPFKNEDCFAYVQPNQPYSARDEQA